MNEANPKSPPMVAPATAVGCDAESVGWRWFSDLKERLAACARHLGNKNVKAENKRYDPPLT